MLISEQDLMRVISRSDPIIYTPCSTFNTLGAYQMKSIYTALKYKAAILAAATLLTVSPAQAEPTVEVWKSPSCGCCKGWTDYLEDNGFDVTVHKTDNMSQVKLEKGLTESALYSCHTAEINGYIVEGHVPVDDIRRLLSEKPDAMGLTAPGMPAMSPGMNSIEPKGYDVLLIADDQSTSVYSSY